MDMTVTAPLDTGTGQQRYVVAYTLKQGIEKQPDILSAQKSMIQFNLVVTLFLTISLSFSSFYTTDSNNVQPFKDTNELTTPPMLRPDALFLGKTNFNSGNGFVSSLNSSFIESNYFQWSLLWFTQSDSPQYQQEYDQKITPSSATNTLRRNNDTKSQTLAKNSHQPPIYDSITTKPLQSALGQQLNAGVGGGIGGVIGVSPLQTQTLRNTLDHRHLTNHDANQPVQYHTMSKTYGQPNHVVNFRQKSNGGTNLMHDEHRLSSGSDHFATNSSDFLNLSNSSIANQLLGTSINGTTTLPSSSRMHTTTTMGGIGGGGGGSKELNRSIHNNNRNHIITDSLPGPESCV